MTKLFVLDDHELIIEGIRSLLENEAEIEMIGSAKNHDDMFRFLKTKTPDIILMDINLPGKNGLEICKEVATQFPHIRIIGLSNSGQPSVIRKMIENGAKAYLLKDAGKYEIMTAIKCVLKGTEYVNYSVSEILKTDLLSKSPVVLTKREKEVLALIAEGLTNHKIAEQLFLDVTTIDSHRKNMITKLGVKNTAALIKLAVSEGII